MYVEREPSKVGDPRKKILQKFDFFDVEAFCERTLMRLGKRTDIPKNPLALLGQNDLVDSSVSAASAPLDEATPLKPIQHCNDPTRPHPDLRTESTLTDPRITPDQAEQARVRSSDIQCLQCPLKTARSVGPELREEEGDSMVWLRRCRHASIIDLLINHSHHV
nr:hypothetical protein [Brevibacterium atlanticum]